MSKTKEELQQLKQDCETLNNKLKELNEDELKQVTGGETWLYEKSYDVLQTNEHSGFIQKTIGDWQNREH